MRAFEPHVEYTFKYPGSMQTILNYLNERGKLNIREDIVERYYGYFSSDKYGAEWVSANEQTLAEFAEYLYNLEV